MLVPIGICLALAAFAFGLGTLFGAALFARPRRRSHDFTPPYQRAEEKPHVLGGWRSDYAGGFKGYRR